MKLILTFTLLMIPGSLSFSVTGYSGGGVTITCRYEGGYTTNAKYFCKGQTPLITCSDLIKTDIKDKWIQEGRFSLYDNTTASVFTVTITDLKKVDSDTYQCVVDRSVIIDVYTEVILTVSEDRCCEKIIHLSAASGASVNFSCKYPQSHRTDVKFVCRRSGADICAHQTSVPESRRWTGEREILLYDDHDLLTVNITNVTDHSSAEFWCGLQTDDKYKIFITQVKLTVTETSDHTTSPPSPTSSSSSLSFSSGQSTLITSSPSSSSALSVSSVQSALVPSGPPVTSSDSSLVVSLSVVLVLIITGLLLLIVILCKRHQTAGSDSTSKRSHITANLNEEVHRTSCDYTEITDIRPADSESRDAADYCTAQLPTIPSDAPNTVYATVKQPISDFRKFDGSDHIRVKNDEDYSEYSTVNHATV